LQRHIRTAHQGLSGYPCTNEGCTAGFDSAGALKRHVDRDHGELRFWCDDCGEKEADNSDEEDDDDTSSRAVGRRVGFTTLAALQAHMRRAHIDCMFCSIRCSSQALLERHIETQHSGTSVAERKTVACTWAGCPKTFTERRNLNAHIRTAHEGQRFVCGKVDTFGTADIADWNWMEEGCGEGFISKMNLEEHIRFLHLGRKRLPRTQTVPNEAEKNIIDAISGLAAAERRNLPCEVDGCTARFIRYHDLNLHLQRNHGYELTGNDDDELNEDVFWFGSTYDNYDSQRDEFESEWADMRKLIDVDALVDGFNR
jgi:hypothetical protein